MKGIRLISAFCALVMLFTCVQIPAFAANIEAIDLSENKTRFTDSDEKVGTIKVYTVDEDGVREEALDNTQFIFESSDNGVVVVNDYGEYDIVGNGASIITVSLNDNPDVKRSMIFYCGGANADYLSIENYEEYISKDGFVNTYEETGGMGTQLMYSIKDDPWTGGQAVAAGPFNGSKVAPQGGSSLTSFILSAWEYDHYTSYADRAKRNAPRLGVTNGSTTGWYAYFGIDPVANGAAGDTLKFFSKDVTSKYLDIPGEDENDNVDGADTNKIVEKVREKGWHHYMLIVTHDAERTEVLKDGADPVTGISEMKWYYDGELVVHLLTSRAIKPTRIMQSPAWVITGNKYKDMEGTGLFRERYIAEINAVAEPFAFQEMNISEEAPFETDGTVELSFNKILDIEKTELSATITETASGEIIEAETEIEGKIFRIIPTYHLMPGREYELSVSGSAFNVTGPFDNVKELDFEQNVTFITENADRYAENLEVTENIEEGTVSVDAEYEGSGKGFLILSQFDEKGVMQKTNAKAVTSSASEEDRALTEEKAEDAVSFEGYVWSGIDSLQIDALSNPASSETLYEREYGNTAVNEEESTLSAIYNVDEGKVLIKVTSKTKRSALPVIVRIVNPKMNVEDATESNFGKIYARAEQLETRSGGVLEYSFELKDGEAGEYAVIVNMPFEDEALTDTFKFISLEDINSAIASVQGSTSENVEVNFAAARALLDLDYTAYDKITNKKIVLMMLAEAPDCESLIAFETLFKDCVQTVKILEDNNLTEFKKNNDKWGIGDTSLYKKYVDAKASDRKSVNEAILNKGFNNYESLKAVFEDAVTVSFLSKVKNYSELFPFIKDINDVLKLELPESTPGAAMRYLAGKLDEIDGIDALKIKYTESIEEKGTGSGSSGGSGGSGGGGGNSSGGLKGSSGGGLTATIGGEYEVPKEEVTAAQTPQWVEEERYLRERKVFNDIESVLWAEESIRELYNLGIISGRSEGIFAPNDYVTREEAAKMLILMAGIDVSAVSIENPFADVRQDAWYAPFVLAAKEKGIVNGKSDTTFGTGEYITREELCTLADRAATSSDIFLDDEFTIFPFDDEIQISSWALNSVKKMRESFIVSGMGGNVFNPKTPVTRAQAAKIIYGVIAYAAQ